jgi:hypothetical protein
MNEQIEQMQQQQGQGGGGAPGGFGGMNAPPPNIAGNVISPPFGGNFPGPGAGAILGQP